MSRVEVVVVGGSFAGLQAAMVLGRHLISVAVFDTFLPRNRYASGVHNVLALDGQTPQEVLDAMRKQTLAYSTVSLRQAKVVRVKNLTPEGGEPSFEVYATPVSEDGKSAEEIVVTCRRLILAHGVSDSLPDIPNINDFWGVGIAHCPHCHGYEVRGKKLAVLKNCIIQGVVMQLAMVKELTKQPVILLTNGELLNESDKKLLPKDIVLIETPISSIEGDKSKRTVNEIKLSDNTSFAIDCIFTMSKTAPNGDFHTQLGLNIENGHTGPFISCDATRLTNVKGVYVAGDTGNNLHQVNMAASSGSMCGLQTHISLLQANLAAQAAASSQ